jgi:thioredoxin reductase (NADPH)
MRAFMLRRLQVTSQGQATPSCWVPDTLPTHCDLREFLSRNGYPYRYVDLDTDNTSQELLDRAVGRRRREGREETCSVGCGKSRDI